MPEKQKERAEKGTKAAVYSKINKHLKEIEDIMKKCEIYEINKTIKADDELVFSAAIKRA